MEKKSFVLHCDSLSILDKLTDEQCGKLLKKMRSYHNGNDYEPNDIIIDIAFESFKNQFDRDLEKFNNVCDRNASNGAKGGRPKKNPENPVGYLGKSENPEKPKKAESDNDNDNDSDSDKENDNDKEGLKILSKDNTPDGEYGNKEINGIIEVMKQACTDAGLQYMPGYKERQFAKHILSKKLASEIEKYNMPLHEFIANIIKLSAQPYMKQVNTPQLFYQNRGHIINSGISSTKSSTTKISYI